MTKDQERMRQRENDAQWAKTIPQTAREHMKHKPYQKREYVAHKAVLVIDMPESCAECALSDLKLNISCSSGKRCSRGRTKRCPLVTLPKKDYGHYFPDEYQDGYAEGWNDCIDAITKGSMAAGKRGRDAGGDDTQKAKTIPSAKEGNRRAGKGN